MRYLVNLDISRILICQSTEVSAQIEAQHISCTITKPTPKLPFHTCTRRRSTAPLSTSPSSYSVESYRPHPLQLGAAPTLTLESPSRALAEEAHLLARWVVEEEEEAGAVASRQQVDTVLALMSTDPIRYHRPDHLAEALHLVAAVVVAAAIDTAADPTIHTLLALDPDHQDPDDGVVEEEEEVMELVGVMIMMPDAAAAAAVSTTIVA